MVVPRTHGMVEVVSDMAVCVEAGLQSTTAAYMVVVAQLTHQLSPVVPVAFHSATVALSTLTTRIERGGMSLSGRLPRLQISLNCKSVMNVDTQWSIVSNRLRPPSAFANCAKLSCQAHRMTI